MKKILALLLTLALCLSFAACQSGEDKPADTLDALPESTDAPMAESTEATEEDIYSHYCGTWVNLQGDTALVMILEPQGKATLGGADYTYAIEDNNIVLSNPENEITLEITDHNGIPRLANRLVPMDFVPEAEKDAFAPITVEITMDNWEEYFVLKESYTTGYVDVVCPEEGVPDFELWLKPEYVYKLLDTPTNEMGTIGNVIFTFNYDAGFYSFKVNKDGVATFTFAEECPEKHKNLIPEPRECPLLDWRSYGMILSDKQCPVFVNGGWIVGRRSDTDGYYLYPVNPTVASASGTITLLP